MALTTVPASLSATALTLTTAAQPNITSVGTLTGLTVSGNIAGTLTTAAQTNITSVGTLSSLTVSGALNGTLSTAAQPNITSVGTLTGLTVSGNIAGTLTTAAQTNITSVGTLSALTVSGGVTAARFDATTASTTDPVLQLTDSGVADYDFTFPDTSTIQLGTNTTSDKTFKLLNSGSGTFNLSIEGSVGIGTPSPAQTLHVSSTAATSNGIRISNSEGSFEARVDQGEFYLYDVDDNRIPFLIDTSGNVGIGTSAPSALAHVYNGTLQVGSKTGDTSIQQNADAIRIAAVPNSSTEWGGLQWYREFSDVIGAEIIAARATSTETDTDLIFKTSTNSSNAVEAMRIDHNGKVTIGVITGGADGTLAVKTNSSTHAIAIEENSGNEVYQLGVDSSGGLNFYNSGSTAASVVFSDNDRVGINVDKNGNSVPQKTLHVEHTAGASEGILISGASDTVGHTAGILLRAEGGEADSALRAKGAIFFERTGLYGVGKLHLAVDSAADNNSATISDANLTLDGSGVGLHTASPQAALDINGSRNVQYGSDGIFRITKNNGNDWSMRLEHGADDYGILAQGNGSYAISVYNQPASAHRARFNYNGELYLNGGSSALYNINSDVRLKEEISDAPSQWELVKGLPLQRFKWKDRREGDKWSYGFIAQEVEKTNPEFVEIVPQNKEDQDSDVTDPEYKTVAEGQIHERALAALQEAMKRIEALEAEVKALKGE